METQDFFKEMITRAVAEAVHDAMEKAVNLLQPKKPEVKALMEVPEAVNYINSLGIKIGKKQFYKHTMNKEIKYQMFGKKLLFKEEDLLVWVNSKLKRNNEINPITLEVAKSAKRKLERSAV